MSAPWVLLLADKDRSSWSMVAWLALRHAGVPFEEELLPFSTPSWRARVRERSPSGRVPALVAEGETIVESLAIAELAAELAPEAELWPRARPARAFARSVATELVTGFSAMRRELSMHVSARLPSPTLSPSARADLTRTFDLVRACRARGVGPYAFGPRFSVVDALMAPAATRLVTYGIDADDEVTRAYFAALLGDPHVTAWCEEATREAREARAPEGAPDPSTAEECWAVVFTSTLSEDEPAGYAETARRMEELARAQPGYLGFESVRDGREGISISYWSSLAAIEAWRRQPEHVAAQREGALRFYDRYRVRTASVERGYEHERAR